MSEFVLRVKAAYIYKHTDPLDDKEQNHIRHDAMD